MDRKKHPCIWVYKYTTTVEFLYGDIMRELSIAIVVAGLVIGLSGRYTITSGGSHSYVVDGLTGKTWMCFVRECRRADY